MMAVEFVNGLRHFRAEIDDPSLIAASSPGWQQRHHVVQRGRYRARLEAVSTPLVQFGCTQISLGRRVTGVAPRGAYTFGIPYWSVGEMTVRGRVVDEFTVGEVRPFEEIDAFFEGPTRQIFVSIDRMLFEQRASALWGRAPGETGVSFINGDWRSRYLRGTRTLLAAATMETPLDPGEFERRVVDQLLIATAPHEQTVGERRRRALAQRARGYIRERIFERVSVADLSSAMATSCRTLENAFRETYGQTPFEFARNERLLRAYHELRHGTNADDVTTVALRYGFDHLGRFAAVYQEFFGELPSVTRRWR